MTTAKKTRRSKGTPMPVADKDTAKQLYDRLDSLAQNATQQGEQIKSITDNMSRLESVVGDLASAVRQQSTTFATQLGELATRQAAQSSMRGLVPVGHIWTVVGIIAAVAGMLIGSGTIWMNRELAPLRGDVKHVADLVAAHQQDGHPHTVIGQINTLRLQNAERFADIETRFKALHTEMGLRTDLAVYRALYGTLPRLDADSEPDPP